MINMINYTAVLKNVKSQKIFFAKKMKIMYDPQIFLNWSVAVFLPYCIGLLNFTFRAGYQAQVTEPSSPENNLQLVTSVIVQGGSESDMTSLPEVVKKLEEHGLLPESKPSAQSVILIFQIHLSIIEQ